MFKSKGLFADVTCPYNGECVLPRCLFGHPPISLHTSKEVSPDKSPYLAGPPRQVDDEGHIAKRRKLESGPSENDSPKSQYTSDNKASRIPHIKQEPPRKASTPLPSVSREVSPPPARRNTIKSTGDRENEGANGNAKAGLPILAKAPSITKMPEKAETLNPRMLNVSKAPHNTRLKLVQLLHEQLVRLNTELSKDASDSELPLVLSPQALITLALDIEEKAGIEKPAVHASVVKNAIIRYKKMSVLDWKKGREAQVQLDNAALAAKESKSKQGKPIETGLPPHLEVAVLSKLYTPLDKLSGHGYVISVPSQESINQAKAGLAAAKGWEVCDRCKARFQIFPGRREEDGLLCSGGKCTYHWGKAFFPSKSATDLKGTKRERRYRCCGQLLGDSPGCTIAETHVYKVSEVKRLASLLNFIETPDNRKVDSDRPICIDGEMGYTVHGLELIRLTATSWPSGAPLLDVLVRPFGEVLDLNSRFSGVNASQLTAAPLLDVDAKDDNLDSEQLAGAKKLHIVKSPTAARDLLLRFVGPGTPIIGHGLENDLNAVRLIHSTVIDTALLFPHPQGLPYRNALRSLVSLHLGRIIQAGGGQLSGTTAADVTAGHDSKEDANAAGDLVRWAVKREWEKMKRMGWTLEEEKLAPPKKISNEFLEDKEIKGIEYGEVKPVAGVKRKEPEGDES